MSDFRYRVSIVIPVYNAEEYIKPCMESLLGQTMDFSQMQVLLINDGSKDSSEELCKEYARRYDNVFLYTKENEGASKARNFGISKAEGKYIFYLDSDDSVKPETVKSVCDFFDSVYDEVDLVTYKIIQYYQGKPSIVHYRYMTLNKTGVYDLNLPENRFITQTHMNICVKNLKENNLTFASVRHEDEKYCCEILRDKMKIGYCAEGEYIYNRSNINSVVSTQFSPELIFETSMKIYEDLFLPYKGKVPAYFQGIVFNDFRWKLMDNKFLPKHLEGEEWLNANRRIDSLLKRMDADTIVLHPSLSVTDMHYWLKRRGGCTVVSAPKEVLVCCEGKVIFSESKFKATRKDGEITVKSPVFCHLKKNQVQFRVNGKPVEFALAVDYTDKNTCEPQSFYPKFRVTEDNAKITVLINSVEYDVK